MAVYFTEETNTLDAKGRVCLPALFRQQLPEGNQDRMYGYPDVKEPRILLFDEFFMQDLLAKMLATPDDSYSTAKVETIEEAEKWQHLKQKAETKQQETYAAVSNGFLTRISQLKIDDTGRILLPQRLIDHADLKRSVTFCGLGRAVGVYDFDIFTRNIAEARTEQEKAREHVSRLVGGLP